MYILNEDRCARLWSSVHLVKTIHCILIICLMANNMFMNKWHLALVSWEHLLSSLGLKTSFKGCYRYAAKRECSRSDFLYCLVSLFHLQADNWRISDEINYHWSSALDTSFFFKIYSLKRNFESPSFMTSGQSLYISSFLALMRHLVASGNISSSMIIFQWLFSWCVMIMVSFMDFIGCIWFLI